MSLRWIPIALLAGLLPSCAPSVTAPRQVLPADIGFESTGGFTVYEDALQISTDGRAVLRQLSHFDNTTVTMRGRLNDSEIATLADLLPSFESFAASYCDGQGPTDTATRVFTMDAATGVQRVVICSGDSGRDVPQALLDLQTTLTRIVQRLQSTASRNPFGTPRSGVRKR